MFDFLSKGKKKGITFGQPGTGMHFITKQEIIRSVLLSTADEILIVDPEREYAEAVKQISSIKQMDSTYTNGMHLLLRAKEKGKKVKSYSGEMKIYSYFDKDDINVYDAATIEELSPKMLSCVCAFQYTTLGAMGLGGLILMFNENGDSYSVSYFGEEIKQDANGNNIHNVYETYAYEYINKYFDLEDKTAVSHGEWRMEKDGWTTITNGLGWYIVCRNDVLNKMPEMNVFEDVEDVMFHFPDYFGE